MKKNIRNKALPFWLRSFSPALCNWFRGTNFNPCYWTKRTLLACFNQDFTLSFLPWHSFWFEKRNEMPTSKRMPWQHNLDSKRALITAWIQKELASAQSSFPSAYVWDGKREVDVAYWLATFTLFRNGSLPLQARERWSLHRPTGERQLLTACFLPLH